jgi:hypothetical protein
VAPERVRLPGREQRLDLGPERIRRPPRSVYPRNSSRLRHPSSSTASSQRPAYLEPPYRDRILVPSASSSRCNREQRSGQKRASPMFLRNVIGSQYSR